jgi:hypothetical protein
VHHLRLREPGWRHSLAINGLGAVLSGAALIVIVVAKFSQGAWVALIVIPLVSGLLTSIHGHYERVERRLSRARASTSDVHGLEVVLVVWELDEALERAVRYVEGLPRTEGIHAVHPGVHEPALEAAFRSRFGSDLRTIPSGRGGAEIRKIVRSLRRGHADRIVLVVIPEKIEALPHPSALHRARARRLRTAVSRESGVAVAIVPTMPEDDSLLSGAPDLHAAIVLVDGADVVADRAIAVASLVTKQRRHVVHLDVDREETERLVQAWEHDEPGSPLEIEPAPIRESADAMAGLIRRVKRGHEAFVTVVLGEVVPPWWQWFLHVDEAREAKAALIREPGTALILVPYPLS